MTHQIGKYGKLAPQFPVALKELRHYQTTPLPPPPASVDHYSAVAAWPMDGNDQYGDCTMAAAAHCIQAWNALARRADPVPASAAVVEQYLKLTHGKDSGLVESAVLKTWKSMGLWANKIVAYAPVNVHDQTSLKQAISIYGLAYVGIQVPANAEEQFSAGQPWSLAPGWQTQRIQGGHAIPLVGYDAHYLYCVTWGKVQPLAYDWWQTYGDEAWAVLPQEFKESGGADGLDIAALQADLALV